MNPVDKVVVRAWVSVCVGAIATTWSWGCQSGFISRNPERSIWQGEAEVGIWRVVGWSGTYTKHGIVVRIQHRHEYGCGRIGWVGLHTSAHLRMHGHSTSLEGSWADEAGRAELYVSDASTYVISFNFQQPWMVVFTDEESDAQRGQVTNSRSYIR